MQQPTLCQRGAAIFTRAWIKSGLALARAREVILGRLRNTKYGRDYFLQKHRDIVRQLKAGQSIRNTAKIVGKGISTVRPKFRQGHLPAATLPHVLFIRRLRFSLRRVFGSADHSTIGLWMRRFV